MILASVSASLNQRCVIMLRGAARVVKYVLLSALVRILLALFGRIVLLRPRDLVERTIGCKQLGAVRPLIRTGSWPRAEFAVEH